MGTPHDAWYESQYNNRARVPDSAVHLQRWAEASALARAQLTAVLDLPYNPAPSARTAERLDVFPARRSGSPVLVFIHGGYWRALDKSDHSFIAPAFVDAGAMVVIPNYSLCPEVAMDTLAMQCVQALAWTWRHAETYGGDPSRIVVAGHSAGGHLTAMMLCCRWAQVGTGLPARLVTAGLSLSGLYDLEPMRHTPFLRQDLALTPRLVARLSPAFFPRPKGPLVSLVGAEESEEFLRQNQLIRDQWGPTTVPVCEALPGRHHFSVLTDLVDPQGRAHLHARRLLGLAAGGLGPD